MESNLLELLEHQELIDKLKTNGHGKLIEILMEHEDKVYTKKGRLNKSGACRVLGWKPKQLEDALEDCKKVLQNEFD